MMAGVSETTLSHGVEAEGRVRQSNETEGDWVTVEPPHLPWMAQQALLDGKILLICFKHT